MLDQDAYCTPANTDFCRNMTSRARSILNQWRLVRAWNDPAQFPCKPERTSCTQPCAVSAYRPGFGMELCARRR